MLRNYLSSLSLMDLPLIGMSIFITIFLLVIVRVCQRGQSAVYREMANMPLDDSAEFTNGSGHSPTKETAMQGGAR